MAKIAQRDSWKVTEKKMPGISAADWEYASEPIVETVTHEKTIRGERL